GRGRCHGVRRGTAGGVRVPAGAGVTASRHPGDLSGRGRGPGAERGPGSLALPRAARVTRRRVPGPCSRPGPDLPAAGAARPGRAEEFSSGDLLARLVSDVDATQDLFIRGIAAPLAAAVVGAASVVACLLILAPAGAVLAAGLLVAGIGVPVLAARAARGA